MQQKPFVRVWSRVSLLLAVLVMAATSAATLAQEPTPPLPVDSDTAWPHQPGIPRHRPGHLAKVDNLDVLLAQGQISHPLAGSDLLATFDKIALIWEDYGSSLITWQPYDVNADLGKPTKKLRFRSAEVAGAGSMDIAAGYFAGPSGFIDTVSAYEQPAGKITMVTMAYDADLRPRKVAPTFDVGDVAGGYQPGWGPIPLEYEFGGFIRLATGDFDADGYDEIVLAWEGQNQILHLRVFDTHGGLTPLATGEISDESLAGGKFLDVATGDFDGDGDAEIAAAWEGQGLSVKVYDVGRDGSLTAEAKLDNQAAPGQLALATGDFNGDRVDEIALAFNTQTEAHVYLYQVSDNLHTLTRKGTASQPSGQVKAGDELVRVVGVGAGDFDINGIDEIAFVYGNQVSQRGDGYCWVEVYDVNASLVPTSSSKIRSSWLSAYGLLSLDVGDMNQDLVDEIVASKLFRTDWLGSNCIQTGIFSVDPDLAAVRQRGLVDQEECVSERGGRSRHQAVAVGAFNGKTVRVGEPKPPQTLTKVKQVVAVINAPPKHRDTVGGETVDINVTDQCQQPTGPPCTYAKYETRQKTTTNMTLETHRKWSVSVKAKSKIKVIEPSLEASYGQDFDKTTTSFKSHSFGEKVIADLDDEVVRIEQTLHVWEYPIYTDGSDVVQGYILVIWPEKTDPTCTGHCEAAEHVHIAGRDPASFYLPNHEFGNALSYSSQVPTDIDTVIYSQGAAYLGVDPYEMWVDWSKVEGSETKRSRGMDLKAGLPLSGKGQSLGIAGEYGKGGTSVNTISFEESTSIHLFMDRIAEGYRYKVQPFMYWAKPDGRLVLDYVVTFPPAVAPPTWWETTYVLPDPAFNLPYKGIKQYEGYWLLSKEITFEPYSPTVGDQVAVTAKVRNYSTQAVPNVPVRFYAGDPDKGGKFIDETTIAILNPQAAVETQVQFDTTAYAGQTVKIYAVLDREGHIEEMHEDNNKAYAQLPVKPVGDPQGTASLSIIEDDIAFDSEMPAADEVVKVAATIHAIGETFTHVGVDFWDGEPMQGGRFIGGQVIPMILAGQTGTADIQLATDGLRGRRDIWVAIHTHPDEHAFSDNRAHRVLNLEPSRQYLPAVWKN